MADCYESRWFAFRYQGEPEKQYIYAETLAAAQERFRPGATWVHATDGVYEDDECIVWLIHVPGETDEPYVHLWDEHHHPWIAAGMLDGQR